MMTTLEKSTKRHEYFCRKNKQIAETHGSDFEIKYHTALYNYHKMVVDIQKKSNKLLTKEQKNFLYGLALVPFLHDQSNNQTIKE